MFQKYDEVSWKISYFNWQYSCCSAAFLWFIYRFSCDVWGFDAVFLLSYIIHWGKTLGSEQLQRLKVKVKHSEYVFQYFSLLNVQITALNDPIYWSIRVRLPKWWVYRLYWVINRVYNLIGYLIAVYRLSARKDELASED